MSDINSIINIFLTNLKKYNLFGYIDGGKCIEYYYNKKIDTFDYDISIFITDEQLYNQNTFILLYNNIIKLYNNLSTIYKLLPIQLLDYSNIYTKYIPNNIINKNIEYINHYIVADIQFETQEFKTLIDINITHTNNIKHIKSIINENYYISLHYLIKQVEEYYSDLKKVNSYKKNIIYNRLLILYYLKKKL